MIFEPIGSQVFKQKIFKFFVSNMFFDVAQSVSVSMSFLVHFYEENFDRANLSIFGEAGPSISHFFQ